MSETGTAMLAETLEAPAAVRRLLDRQGGSIERLGARLAGLSPASLATGARGSSDHAASFLKYAVEIATGIPVASVGPSVASIYGTALRMPGGAFFSISQSGGSPDIVALQASARAGGALVAALVNTVPSPLADGADVVIDLEAGPERSVAATKSFICSVAAGAAILAAWTGDEPLRAALRRLPDALEAAAGTDWGAAATALAEARSLFVVGRGPGFAIAREAALKCKEAAGLHAEAFSLAEAMHGPIQILEPGFPVLALLPADAAAASSGELAARLAGLGANVFTVGGSAAGARALAFEATGHGLTDAIAMSASVYRLVERVAHLRGLDPDRPSRLRKVTRTV